MDRKHPFDRQENQQYQQLFQELSGTETWASIKELPPKTPQVDEFMIKDTDGKCCLVRLIDRTHYNRAKQEYEILKMLSQQGLPVPRPENFGLCNGTQSVFMVTRWVYGRPAAERLPEHQMPDQYLLGQEMAVCLQAIHSLTAPVQAAQWKKDIHRTIKRLRKVCYQHDRSIRIRRMHQFIEESQTIINDQPQALLHGDLCSDHLIFSEEKSFCLTNFGKWRFGDPLADLAPIMTDISQISDCFATGFMDGYFGAQISTRTFHLLAFYAVLRTLDQYVAACARDEQPHTEASQAINILYQEFNGFSSVIPSWYRSGPKSG